MASRTSTTSGMTLTVAQPAPAPALAEATDAPVKAAQPVRRLSSDSVFAGAVEVLISHHGTDYRLRQTTLGKLILTK